MKNPDCDPLALTTAVNTLAVAIAGRLPDDRETVRVTLTLDGVQVSDDEDIRCSEGTLKAELTGTGTKTLDVYYDGVWAYSEQVTFE